MKKIIEIKDLNFKYNFNKGFDSFSMEINEGNIVSLIGPSGSGKSTLLKVLCNKLPNDTMFYRGENVKTYDICELQKNIVTVFDGKFNCNTVIEELKYYLIKIGFSEFEINEKLNKIVDFFHLNDIINSITSNLSYNKKVLIKILRYLIINPDFIAIDSLFSGLTKKDKNMIIDYIKTNKMTLLNVICDLNDSIYGDKIFVLDNFTIILEGSTLSILKTDTILKRMGFTLPLAVDLSIELNHYEVLNKIYTDKERLIRELWK